jgi:hypothetical protein
MAKQQKFNPNGPEMKYEMVLDRRNYQIWPGKSTTGPFDEFGKFKSGTKTIEIEVRSGKIRPPKGNRDKSVEFDVLDKETRLVVDISSTPVRIYMGRLGKYLGIEDGQTVLLPGSEVKAAVRQAIEEYRQALVEMENKIALDPAEVARRVENGLRDGKHNEFEEIMLLAVKIEKLKDECNFDGYLFVKHPHYPPGMSLPELTYGLAISEKYRSVSSASGMVHFDLAFGGGVSGYVESFIPWYPNMVAQGEASRRIVIGDEVLLTFKELK